MENLWKIEGEKEINTPYLYIKQQCSYLAEATGNKLIARVKEYNGAYRSYNPITAIHTVFENPFQLQEKNFNVQDELGDKDSQFVYEFFITSRNNPNYKYRMLFMAYGISIYPTFISLEKSLAEELECETEFYIDNEEHFVEFLRDVLSSHRISYVISNLLSMEEK